MNTQANACKQTQLVSCNVSCDADGNLKDSLIKTQKVCVPSTSRLASSSIATAVYPCCPSPWMIVLVIQSSPGPCTVIIFSLPAPRLSRKYSSESHSFPSNKLIQSSPVTMTHVPSGTCIREKH